MRMEEALGAVLIPPHLDLLCRQFSIRREDLTPVFEGWTKHVLLSPDRVFLFPRHPRFDGWLERELGIYGALGDIPGIPLPKLIAVVDDPRMSYYRFGVVSRLKGVPFWTIEEEIGVPEYETLLSNLGRLIAVWHGVPLESLREIVGPIEPEAHGNLADQCRWMLRILSLATTDEMLDAIAGQIGSMLQDLRGHRFEDLLSDRNRQRWREVVNELASLDSVLIHGDVAEAQMLVRSKDDLEITGILDWSTAAIGNPLLDFNFWEWGTGIWRFRGDFGRLRRTMWEAYLEARGIRLSTLEGLHLFYVFQEIDWAARKARPLIQGDRPLDEEVRCILHELETVTLSI